MKNTYTVNYNTGAGNFEVSGPLYDAKNEADESACYTCEPITITDSDGKTVSRRSWWGCTDGIEDCEYPIQFGDFGYYGDWEDC